MLSPFIDFTLSQSVSCLSVCQVLTFFVIVQCKFAQTRTCVFYVLTDGIEMEMLTSCHGFRSHV